MTRPGSGVGIAILLFRIEELVQMIVPQVHARRRDALGFLVTQFRGLETPAHALEFLELLILVRRDEISGERAVAGDRNRLALRLHLVAAEVAGELGGRNGVSHDHASSLPSADYTRFTQRMQLARFARWAGSTEL